MALPFNLDLITGISSLIFSLMIFSYLIGDNFLFKIALYIFTGVSAGYIAAVASWQVLILLTKFTLPLITGAPQDFVLLIPPIAGIFMILMKVSPHLAGIGRLAMAYIVGAGSAVAIVGALSGTLIPQVESTINAFDPNIGLFNLMINGLSILLGTTLTLIYFHFGARTKPDGSVHRLGIIEILAWLGRFFIGVTLGVVFAGVYSAALTALIERISSIVSFFGIIP